MRRLKERASIGVAGPPAAYGPERLRVLVDHEQAGQVPGQAASLPHLDEVGDGILETARRGKASNGAME